MSKTYKPLDEILKQSGVRYEAIAKNMGITYNALYRIRLAPNKLTLDKVKELIGLILTAKARKYRFCFPFNSIIYFSVSIF